jgi:hypothetical protein
MMIPDSLVSNAAIGSQSSSRKALELTANVEKPFALLEVVEVEVVWSSAANAINDECDVDGETLLLPNRPVEVARSAEVLPDAVTADRRALNVTTDDGGGDDDGDGEADEILGATDWNNWPVVVVVVLLLLLLLFDTAELDDKVLEDAGVRLVD